MSKQTINKKQNLKKSRTNKEKKPFTLKFDNFLNNKYIQLLFIIIISIVYVNNYSAIFEKKLDTGGDNLHYISLGKAISEGKGFTNIMGFTEEPHKHFPPGYPVFIAGLTKIFPNNYIAFKIINGIFLYLSIIFLFFIFKKITDNNVILSFIVCLLCCVHPDLLKWATIIMSEMLYMFLTVAVIFIAHEIYESNIQKRNKWLFYFITAIMVLMINYIYFVRTMGLSMILSVILWFAIISLTAFITFRKNKLSNENASQNIEFKKIFLTRISIFIIIIVSFLASKQAWDIRNKSVGKTEFAYSSQFTKKLYGEKMSTTKDWIDRIKSNSKNYLTKWVPNSIFFTKFDIKGPTSKWEWIRGILILLTMVFGLIKLKKLRWLIAFYIMWTMTVLIIYPEQYGGSRYYMAIIPFFIFLTLNGISELVALLWRLFPSKYKANLWQKITICAIAFIFMMPSSISAQKNLRELSKLKSWKDANSLPLKEYFEAIEWCNIHLPSNARVMCRKPELYYIYSGYKHAEVFPQYAEPDTVISIFIKKKATHVILDNMYRHAYVTVAPAIVKHPEKFKLIHTIGEFNKEAKRNATLIYEFNNEWGYYGDRVDGIKQGKGYEIYQDGRKYVGEFANNLPNGFGEFFAPNGQLLVKGLWKDGSLIKPEP